MRALDRLEQLYAIGGGPGANRIGYSPEEDEAHALARGWLEEAELEVDVDEAGNLFGRSASSPGIWTGSHLDTVPQGGKFDGALGVVAAIEAVEQGGRGTVAVFRDEERGCVGSRAFVGHGVLPEAFVELHIEQGPRLAAVDAPLGVVTGIVGYARGEVVVEGRASHAGTTPMELRDDALVRAAREVLRVEEEARRIPEAVATVGCIEAEPGGINVIPGRVRFSVDVRAPDQERLDRLIALTGIDVDRRRAADGDEPRDPGGAPGRDRGARSAGARAALRSGPRRGRARARGCAERDALRPQPQRRRLAFARRALVR